MSGYGYHAIVTAAIMVASLPLAMLPLLGGVVRRYGALHGLPLLNGIGLVGSASALAAFTVFPLPNPNELECRRDTLSDYWVLNPLDSFLDVGAHGVGFPAVLWSSPMLQLVFNVALFVPFGYFLQLVMRWRWWVTAVVAAVASALIELTQGTGFWWAYPCPYRLFDTSDLLMNTLGGVLGASLAIWALRRVPALTPSPLPPGPVRVRRRITAVVVDLFLVFVTNVAIMVAVRVVLSMVWDTERMLAWSDANTWILGASSIVSSVLIALVIPLLRADRATPGQWILAVTPHRSAEPEVPPTRLAAFKRYILRYVWWAIDPAQFIGFLMIVVDVATIALRKDRRSMTGLVSDIDVRSQPRVGAASPASAQSAADAASPASPGEADA